MTLPDDEPVLVRDAPRRRRDERHLGDFTTSVGVLKLVPLAVGIGLVGALVAVGLLDLIGLITNALYYHRLSATLVSPAGNRLGGTAVLLPVIGGLVIGLMARYGSERIRGHGIPEAMETILVGGSRVQPRLALLKPVSSAISIGTGGPFGAEGPIILTGGALGSVAGQFLHLTAIERRTLLVAGSAAGMSAVFGTPIAAVLLAVELLLFEWKPRSMVVVGISSVVAAALRARFAQWGLLAAAPLFPVPWHPPLDELALVGALAVGLVGGLLAWALTGAVYASEDLFAKLRLHWVWWPALGGVVVGVGGLVQPRALGVGYDTIADELSGRLAIGVLVAVLLTKLVVWAVALGSGTSGGILAPLLMMGAAVGGMLGTGLPHGGTALWCEVGMCAALAGVMRSPLTAIIFTFELTRDANSLLALLLAATVAHLMSVLLLRRSILTEKVARRGFHVTREYAVDPLEALFVRDVMSTRLLTLAPSTTIDSVYASLREGSEQRRQRLYPVVEDGVLTGVLAWSNVLEARDGSGGARVADVLRADHIVAYADETLRHVADRMAARQVGVLPVVERDEPTRLRGIVSQFDLLRARERILEEERVRGRTLRLRALPLPSRPRQPAAASAAD